jgi:hypothetical protein
MGIRNRQYIGGGNMKETLQDRYLIERAYRNAFGLCSPSTTDFPKEALFELGFKAILRGSPVTEEELQAWIAKNSPPTKP